MDYSLPDSSVHGILLEWVAISSSRGSSRPRDQICISYIAGRFFTVWVTREALTDINWLLIIRGPYSNTLNLLQAQTYLLPTKSLWKVSMTVTPFYRWERLGHRTKGWTWDVWLQSPRSQPCCPLEDLGWELVMLSCCLFCPNVAPPLVFSGIAKH